MANISLHQWNLLPIELDCYKNEMKLYTSVHVYSAKYVFEWKTAIQLSGEHVPLFINSLDICT